MLELTIRGRPFGDLPDWIGDAWVGLTLVANGPAYTPSEAPVSIMSGRLMPIEPVFRVPAKMAFDLLEVERPQAYAWWKRMVPDFRELDALCFNEACAEEIGEAP